MDSALAFDRKYVRSSRLDVVSKPFTRMAQEVLYKQTKTAFNVLATALCKGKGTNNTAGSQVIQSADDDRFVLADFNSLITKSKRINSSWSGGTPIGGVKSGITDLLVSPEMVEQLRAMAYNPINTVEAPYSGALKDSLPAPESLREQLYSAAGLPAFYGINIMEINQLGVDQLFNKLFAAIASSEGAPSFTQGSEEILIGIDRTKDALIRPTVIGEGSPSEFQVLVDDQFSVRQNKIGYYGKVEEGRSCINDRALIGLIV